MTVIPIHGRDSKVRKMPHHGQLMTVIKDRCARCDANDALGDTPLIIEAEVNGYTCYGIMGTMTDPRDGRVYRMLLAPADSSVWGKT